MKHNRYEVEKLREETVGTWIAWIYVAGDMDTIRNTCRDATFPSGMCVSIKRMESIYAGGLEMGAEVTLFQYPPFKESETELEQKMNDLAVRLLEANFQFSCTVVMPDKTIFLSRRKKI